ncbi:SDR family NAD(P)-dependent oxidoreductase [Tropicimonas isoalkanivorans]|uniref:Gluconate 5-dehydrogenase n=1 Tax=Tropicimonas isoalkanivorans TaxID=441112 RepID=A0A1I1HFH6_9RHOB|nr:glucose 1-dehydrogenase [Tropicimonas isoalkanivorans]SFC22757.1 gluconate 5-dehydrogenase [Tropicimonas isoalkanivorans]
MSIHVKVNDRKTHMMEQTEGRSDVTYNFTGRRVLVTGASRGIGRALAMAFGRSGADLVLTARNAESLDDTATQLAKLGCDVDCLSVDQRDVGQIQERLAGLPRVDVLINNAGVEEVRASLDVDEPLWDKIVGTNLKGAFFVAQAVAAKMVENGGGAIVNLASLTSYVGVPTAVPYGASKTGILGITRALAAEWAPKGIRVNAIAPGYFKTDLTGVFYEDPAWVEAMTAKVPLGRLGRLDDLEGAAMFLASSAADYVTGQCIVIDGGFLAQI